MARPYVLKNNLRRKIVALGQRIVRPGATIEVSSEEWNSLACQKALALGRLVLVDIRLPWNPPVPQKAKCETEPTLHEVLDLPDISDVDNEFVDEEPEPPVYMPEPAEFPVEEPVCLPPPVVVQRTLDDLTALSYRELQAEARRLGLPTGGKSGEIAHRIFIFEEARHAAEVPAL